MNKFIPAVLAFSVSIAPWSQSVASDSRGEIRPEVLLNEIRTSGVEAVVKRLWPRNGWSEVIDHIETGQVEWLEVAGELHAGTDAGLSEMLSLAAGVALAQAPVPVLRRLAEPLSLEGICGYPDLGDARFDTKQKALGYVDDRINAVAKLTDTDIAASKEECLRYLRQVRIELTGPDSPFSDH